MDDQHAIFRRDPDELVQYVHCLVRITTTDRKLHTGWVYTVDPVSSTFVLLQYKENFYLDKMRMERK